MCWSNVLSWWRLVFDSIRLAQMYAIAKKDRWIARYYIKESIRYLNCAFDELPIITKNYT